jgi:hypothetical protein
VRPTRTQFLLAAALAVACGYILFGLSLLPYGSTDYTNEAERAFLALQDGHIRRFLDLCPAYGGSLILRAPLVPLASPWNGSHLALYRVVSMPGLVAIVGFGFFLWRDALRVGVRANAAWFTLIVISGNLLALMALHSGHSEEPLTAVTIAAAALAAGRQRVISAAVLLGLAVAMKPWALVAVGPLTLMLDVGRDRLRFLALSCATALLVLSPLLLLGGSTLTATATSTGLTFKPWQVWWFLGDHVSTATERRLHLHAGYRVPPVWVTRVSHPAVILLPAVLCLARPHLLRGRAPEEGLLLLGFVLMIRCLVDTWNHGYYALPAVVILAMWEVRVRRRAPVLAGLITALTFLCIYVPGKAVPADVQALVYLAWAVPLTAALGFRVLAPSRFSTWARHVRAWPQRARAELARGSAAGS